MGNLEQSDRLSSRWAELTQERSLQSVPYKIELNAWGKLEMSPASYRHGLLQGLLIGELSRQLGGGTVLGEVPILTDIGVRVPDLAWISHVRMAALGDVSPLPRAPELCVEIVSPSDSEVEIREKTRAYLAAGAQEVWIVAEEGTTRYFDLHGEQAGSLFKVEIALPKPPRAS